MLKNSQLSDLIGMIYDAAGSPSLWQRFVVEASILFNAHMSNLILVDTLQPESTVIKSHGVEPSVLSDLSERVNEDYWINGGKQLAPGTVVFGTEIISLESMHKTRFYKEMAAPNKVEYMLGAVIENQPERQALISFIRGKQEGNFNEANKQTLALLMPHIQRAHFIHRQLTNKTSMEQALHDSPYGVLLIDTDGRSIFTNKAAEQFFLDQDGITQRYGELKVHHYSEQLELDNLINSAQCRAIDPRENSGGIIRVSRPSGKLPYQISVAPLGVESNNSGSNGIASFLLFIHDPASTPSLSKNILKTAYSLTEAEASLCEIMFDGKSLADTANQLDISHNTAKTHLKRIFEKCNVNTQAALMRLLALGLKG